MTIDYYKFMLETELSKQDCSYLERVGTELYLESRSFSGNKLSIAEKLRGRKVLRKYAENTPNVVPVGAMEWVVNEQTDSVAASSTKGTKGSKKSCAIDIVRDYEIYLKGMNKKVCRIRYKGRVHGDKEMITNSSWSVSPKQHEDYYLLAFFLKIGLEDPTVRKLIAKLEYEMA